MKRLWWIFLVCLIFPVFICKADVPAFNILPDAQIRSDLSSLTDGKKHDYTGFLSAASPEYRVRKNIVALTRGPDTRSSQSVRFVFLMNSGRVNLDKIKKINPLVAEADARPRMHLLWTGSKKVFQQQKVIQDEYPVDVSIANYEEGFASEEWNVVLPNKKPREVSLSLKWIF